MQEARHPFTGKPITAEQYFLEFGRPVASSSAVDNRPRAKCPFCPQRMSVVGAAKGGHFAHLPKSLWCPSKEKTAEPYLKLTPTEPDDEAAARLKADFRETWPLHYARLEEIAPGFSHREFIVLLSRANQLNIWAYKDLQLQHLPYILPLLADFSPATGRQLRNDANANVPVRRLWLRFMYSSEVRRAEDLWIHPSGKVEFFRVSYRPPARSAPRPKDILKSVEIERTDAFLSATPRLLPGFVIAEIEKWLDLHMD
ncbi:hypothetical protein [Paraburkholderia azotifigens]|uniref:Competence protein CoiA n=1 Tax=Paraburkholderia azotifigens TaxID=2057004 RepID=A0A5C6V5Y8_9BURK|nr:hypothetical protein [Paraburkholderia azotifigens]TXC79125.1 hypothetical protein FRZ40_32425 [Paraburkholderia azotifigens]